MINEATIDGLVLQLFRNIRFSEEPAGLYDPLRYMIEIGGKRIRPRLCLTAYSLFKDEIGEEIHEPAMALEVFHTFTLLHDDIMDKSPLRRGKPTVWTKWSEDTAILSGDVMQIDAYRRMSMAPADKLPEVLSLFSKTAAQVCEGQQYDMEFETESEVSMADYEKMIGLKTAVLLACSAAIGAIVAGAGDEAVKALYNYGYELGMAFQVADDYLDAFGDEKIFGKPIGGDILNEKKSWLTVRAMEKLEDRNSFLKAFTAKAVTDAEKKVKIASVKDFYVSAGVPRDAETEMMKYTDRAMDAVRDLNLGGVRIETLKRFAEKLVGRAK